MVAVIVHRYCAECGSRVEREDVEIDPLGVRPTATSPVPPPRVTLHPCGHNEAVAWQSATVSDDMVRDLIETQRRRCILALGNTAEFSVREIMSTLDVLESFMDGDR